MPIRLTSTSETGLMIDRSPSAAKQARYRERKNARTVRHEEAIKAIVGLLSECDEPNARAALRVARNAMHDRSICG